MGTLALQIAKAHDAHVTAVDTTGKLEMLRSLGADEVIDFTQAYTPPDPSNYAALSADVDLIGGVIAAQAGTIQASYVADSGAILVEFSSPDETIAAIVNGEVDAVLADASFIGTAIETNGDLMVVGDPVALGGGVGMANCAPSSTRPFSR